MKKKINREFQEWLTRMNMDIFQFANMTQVREATANSWLHGAKPRPVFAKIVERIYPDCPILNKERHATTQDKATGEVNPR